MPFIIKDGALLHDLGRIVRTGIRVEKCPWSIKRGFITLRNARPVPPTAAAVNTCSFEWVL